MKGYDAFAGVIKSGGKTRRAAKMVILDADHPDIVEFINCKVEEEKKAWALIDAGYDGSFTGPAYSSVFFQNSNNSVRVPDEFMRAVLDDSTWETHGIRTGEVMELDTSPNSGPARGAFDPFGNYWSGGRGGVLVKADPVKKKVWEYPLPTPHASLYQAMADKNGEVWGGEQHAGRYLRFNPKSEQWTEYLLPEPYGHDRHSWVDNSTNPVTVWYTDHDGWVVRLQPLE